MKRFSTFYVIRDMQIKQWDITIHLSERLKSRTLAHQTLVKMWINRNSQVLLMGMQNGTTILEDSLVVSYETKYSLTIWADNYSPWYLSKRAENLRTHGNLPMGIYSSFVHNCHNMKATNMPFSRWLDK